MEQDRFPIACHFSPYLSLLSLSILPRYGTIDGKGCLVGTKSVGSRDIDPFPVSAIGNALEKCPGVIDGNGGLTSGNRDSDGRHSSSIGARPDVGDIHAAGVRTQVDGPAEVEGNLALAAIIGGWRDGSAYAGHGGGLRTRPRYS